MPKSKKQPELLPWNKNVLDLMDWAKMSFKMPNNEFCRRIDFTYSNLPKIKSGEKGFRIEQLVNTSRITGVSMDVICEVKTDVITIDKIKAELKS